MSFAKLAALLNTANLHFTRVDQFDDHFEGAWPKSDLEHWRKVALTPVYFTEQMRARAAASCWIESPHESAALWRLYGSGKEGVAITTTFGKLVDVIKLSRSMPPVGLAGAGRVKYIDHASKGLIEQIKEGEPMPNVFAPFMLKNISYEHEKEVRALLLAERGYEIAQEGIDLPIDLVNFIDQIVTNPFCEPWFTEAVAGLVARHNLASKLRPSALSRPMFYKDRFYEGLKKTGKNE